MTKKNFVNQYLLFAIIYFKVESTITEKNITKLHVYITNNLNMSYLSTIGQVAPYFTVHLS